MSLKAEVLGHVLSVGPSLAYRLLNRLCSSSAVGGNQKKRTTLRNSMHPHSVPPSQGAVAKGLMSELLSSNPSDSWNRLQHQVTLNGMKCGHQMGVNVVCECVSPA